MNLHLRTQLSWPGPTHPATCTGSPGVTLSRTEWAVPLTCRQLTVILKGCLHPAAATIRCLSLRRLCVVEQHCVCHLHVPHRKLIDNGISYPDHEQFGTLHGFMPATVCRLSLLDSQGCTAGIPCCLIRARYSGLGAGRGHHSRRTAWTSGNPAIRNSTPDRANVEILHQSEPTCRLT